MKKDADVAHQTQESVSPPSPTQRNKEDESRELSLSFPPVEKDEPVKESNEDIFKSHATPEPPWHPPDPPFTFARDEFDVRTDTSAKKEETFKESWEISSPPLKTEEAVSGLAEDRPISTRRCLTFFSLLVLVYSALTWTHHLQPGSIESILRATPWLGSVLFSNRHVSQGIILESVHPNFQTISGNREVLVVSGTAFNRNSVSVREVQVEGYIYDTEGKEIDRQVVWVGSALSPKIIRNLTAQEITILQKLSPAMSFEISPQESATFVIVFLRPKAEIKDFSCRILSAEEVI